MTICSAKRLRSVAAIITTAIVSAQPPARADVILDWNSLMQATVSGQAPFPQARFAAITQLAVFEAVNAIRKDYQPYVGTVAAPADASPEAAAVAAAHAVLKNYFPASAAILDAARTVSLAAIPEGPAKSAGISVGESAAAAVIATRNGDGSTPAQFYTPTAQNPGEWWATPGCTAAGGAFLHWRNLKTFVLRSADQFRSDEPPALTSTSYARDLNEVKAMGGANSSLRTPDRTDVARFYAAVSPIAVWNPIARQLSASAGSSLPENARAFAVLNLALSDAAVAVFDAKYRYNTWRPETAIRMADTDRNERTEPDAAFVPLITAPCFPSYPSAHATLSGAAREVLEQLFGSRRQTLVLTDLAVQGVTLRYRKLKEITADIDDARVYGGIHFRFDQDEGAELGRRVGQYVIRNGLGSVRGACSAGDGKI
jgi:hypothetical protein